LQPDSRAFSRLMRRSLYGSWRRRPTDNVRSPDGSGRRQDSGRCPDCSGRRPDGFGGF